MIDRFLDIFYNEQNRKFDNKIPKLTLRDRTNTEVITPILWSGLRGSNSLPPPWQGGALPDELNPH